VGDRVADRVASDRVGELWAAVRDVADAHADDAVPELAKKGFRAARLEDEFPEWQRAGLPVASGA